MTFGDAITTSKGVGVYLGPHPGERCLLWRRPHVYVAPLHICRRWRCARCQGSQVWWSLTHAPTCARCTPMPPEVYDAAWRDAAKLITHVVQGVEDPAKRAALRAEFDDVLLGGSLVELLQYGVVHRLLELREKKIDSEAI